ncbi:MAG: hypothetical protein H6R10_1373 [Rhodocyclaceae bacterium]|nr:hypothetical protein [Rhodocyclaceae bacterium]
MGPAPYEHQSELVRTVWSGINEAIEKVNYYAGKTTGYAPAFLASLLHYFYSIYGECQEEKALAFCGILADAPVGDVVEIGTFFGKSAFLLTRLSAHLGLGPVLAVDSWDMQTSVQTDSPTEIQSLSTVWDWKLVFDGFLVTMAASATGREFNYLRQRSAEAWETYDSAVPIHSPEFGETRMTGKIGLLHIDGNHDETSVRLDFDLWRRRLADGGWVVFDDYTWSHGDGPRKVADQVIGELRQQILRRFISGGALFIKIAQEH